NISSENVEIWNWGIENKTYTPDQVSGIAKLENDMENVPTFYPPEITDDNTVAENVTLKILVVDDNENYDNKSTTVVIVNSIKSRPNGPYRVYEGESKELDGSKSCGKDKEYNWGIKNPFGKMSIENDLSPIPIFHAPEDIEGKRENVKITLQITSGCENYYKFAHTYRYDNASTNITIMGIPPDPPENLRVEGEVSPLNVDSLTPDLEAKYVCPNQHNLAEKVGIVLKKETGENILNENINVNLEPSEKWAESVGFLYPDPLEPGASYTWKVRFKNDAGWGPWTESEFKISEDLFIKAKAENIRENAGSTVKLLDPGEGYITDYKWEIVNDPTGEAFLENDNTGTPVFHAPKIIERDVEIKIKVTVSNKWGEYTENMKALISPVPPDKPKNLLIEDRSSPENVTTLTPDLFATYSCRNTHSEVRKIDIRVSKEGGETVWRENRDTENILVGDEVKIPYESSVLLPDTTYIFKVRFKNNADWGPWGDSEFSTIKLQSLNTSEAEKLLTSGSIPLSTKARIVEGALEEDIQDTIFILEGIQQGSLADLLAEMARSSSSPKHAALILDNISENKAVDIVISMIRSDREYYKELDNIFVREELSQKRLNLIYERVSKLYPGRTELLKRNLSVEAKKRISSIELNMGDSGIPLFWKIAIGCGIFVFLLIIVVLGDRIKRILGVGESKEGDKEAKDEESGEEEDEEVENKVEKKWNNLIRKFLDNAKERMLIETNLPPEEVVESSRQAIERLDLEEEVEVEEKDDDIYLVMKGE
ncbi:hypothetical protein AKJ51_02300, partial [candidate division MSBL1 archaeon SCGC-AAA382A20]